MSSDRDPSTAPDRGPTTGRRTFVRTVGAVAAAAGAAAATPDTAAAAPDTTTAGTTTGGAGDGSGVSGTGGGSEPDYGGWFDGVDSFDGTVDRTGESSITVKVGADGNGGPYAFSPTAVTVSPGTTVTFDWVSDTHTVSVQSTPAGADWSGHTSIENEGFTYEHTFEASGVYTYYCQPHRALGMKGAIVVEGAPQEPDYGGWFADVENYSSTADERGKRDVTVTVGAQGNGGTYAFDPPAVRVDPGTSVTFDWVSDTHTVTVEDQPSGANWNGHAQIENQGFTDEYTFETEGIYKYYCEPHRALGMKGAIVVGTPAAASSGGIDVKPTPTLLGIGGAALLAFVSPILFGIYLFTRYREESPVPPMAAPEYPVTEEAVEAEPDVALTHDEFDPYGTAALVVLYFLILVFMWIFMYFFEFLGRGITVIG